jgi:hypothetical protein
MELTVADYYYYATAGGAKIWVSLTCQSSGTERR